MLKDAAHRLWIGFTAATEDAPLGIEEYDDKSGQTAPGQKADRLYALKKDRWRA
ncbi:hypothetical protein GCM10007880_39440 [Mesorhizobium amorphae]|uniref:Uncharacterized protein n=1 Tax=Mesorhizobium amorphae CCNWGS0123 TaxID=1082933 RepID=G6YKQ0_9HYPH|nr:hypothetical protein MEA186_32927 [Mesorhizobium amorphae CCNWGS0123]GLR43427.1 hypothetical protein GCM10007880_39440 [Mesorhizobium amorphae]